MKHGTRARGGCQEGRNCVLFHPKMCFNSLRKGECFDKSCQLTHVKGTRGNPQILENTHNINRDDCYLDSEQNTKYQQNKEMDFLAVLQKFKKDIMEEIEQKMTKLMGTTVKKDSPQIPQQYPCLQPINNKPIWTPQSISWGMTPSPNDQSELLKSFSILNVQGLKPQTVQSTVSYIKNKSFFF